jgi:hypothetical protein
LAVGAGFSHALPDVLELFARVGRGALEWAREVPMLALLLAVLASVAPAQNPPVITPDEAAKHIGESVVVRGKISQIVLSVNLTTHINFGGVYPNHVFTVAIYKDKQTLFAGVRDYDGKVVQVQGVVHLYRGKPEIMLTERAQIRLAD